MIYFSKSPTFLDNFCKGVKVYHLSSEIIFEQLLETFAIFYSGHTVRDGPIAALDMHGCGKLGMKI